MTRSAALGALAEANPEPITDYMTIYLAATEAVHICDCCRRQVEKVRGSMWHGTSRICSECFIEWYDGDRPITCEADLGSPLSIGNWIRKRHGLPPMEAHDD